MVVELSIATIVDCDELGQIISKAYAEDPTMRQLTLKVKPEEADAF